MRVVERLQRLSSAGVFERRLLRPKIADRAEQATARNARAAHSCLGRTAGQRPMRTQDGVLYDLLRIEGVLQMP